MKKHYKYLRYLLRHKWFVFLAGLKTGAPLWRLIIHDWSKFLPSEWVSYAEYFYGENREDRQFNDWAEATELYGHADGAPYRFFLSERFKVAWNHHQKRQPHHWQYWVLIQDEDKPRYIPVGMPDKFIREMVADWAGAGRAITGTWDVADWYVKNKSNMILRLEDFDRIEKLLTEHFNLDVWKVLNANSGHTLGHSPSQTP